MQKLLSMFFSIIIFFVALQSVQVNVYAEQLNNVKDCFENPKNCNEELLRYKGENDTITEKEKEEKKSNNDTTTENENKESKSVGVTIWDFVKMIFATIFVVALLYFLLKFINEKSRRFRSTQLVENLGGTSLGANRSLQIVKVGDRVFVVGVGENVQLIKEIDDKEEVSKLLSEYNRYIDELSSPSDFVTKVFKRAKKATSKNEKINSQSFASVFEKQLGELTKGRKKMFEQMKKEGSDKHE